MATMTTKLPTSERPLIHDPDLAAAVLAEKQRLLERVPATKRDKAEDRLDAAIRRVASSAVQGPFSTIVEAYGAAMAAAVGADKET